MQVLADLVKAGVRGQQGRNLEPETRNPKQYGDCSDSSVATTSSTTSEAFKPYCLTSRDGIEPDVFSDNLAQLGYERVPLVEMEGQWSRRGDIVDVFPVSSEL